MDNLRAALEDFGAALVNCVQQGVEPADALRRCGISVPGWASPMVRSWATGIAYSEQPIGGHGLGDLTPER